MNLKYYSLVLIFTTFFIKAQNLNFKDVNFKNAIINSGVDLNNDNQIQIEEANLVQKLNLTKSKIKLIDDIYLFKNLKSIILNDNEINTIRLEDLPNLEEFYCANSGVTNFEAENLPLLKGLYLGKNNLEKISLKKTKNIEALYLFNNRIRNLDLRELKSLKYGSFDGNQLSKLDISKNTKLIQITIQKNNIEELDVKNNPDLKLNIVYRDEKVRIITKKNGLIQQAILPPPASVIQK